MISYQELKDLRLMGVKDEWLQGIYVINIAGYKDYWLMGQGQYFIVPLVSIARYDKGYGIHELWVV